MTFDALGPREHARPRVRRVERMNLAVLRRHVHDAHLLAPTAAIRVGAHDDGRAGFQRVSIQAVDERLRDADALAFDERKSLLWSHENGPQGGDELNLIIPGRNYGWPVISHGRHYSGEPIPGGTASEGMEQPQHVWTPAIAPSDDCSHW